jgi:glycosyltransferase involved in cell wall biosynthesis
MPLKVLQVLPELNSGGVERGTLEVAAHLVGQGHESVVLSAGGRLVPDLEAAGSRHLALPVHKKSPFTLLQVGKVRDLLRRERPDILHLRSRLPAWICWLAWRRLDPATRPRLVTTVHGFNSVGGYSAIMTRGEKVICVSNAVRDFVLESYPATEPGKLTVIHRGIDPAQYRRGHKPAPEWIANWEAEFPETSGKRLLVLPGRLTRLKGHGEFIELISHLRGTHPDVHGVIVGGAHPHKKEYANSLRELVRSLHLDGCITFTGQRSDLREILAVATLTFSLTQKSESFGRTVLESLALGTPVIGYEGGGVGEILDVLLRDGAIPRNPDALLTKTTEFLARSPANRIPVEHPFTLDAMLGSTLGLYQSLA